MPYSVFRIPYAPTSIWQTNKYKFINTPFNVHHDGNLQITLLWQWRRWRRHVLHCECCNFYLFYFSILSMIEHIYLITTELYVRTYRNTVLIIYIIRFVFGSWWVDVGGSRGWGIVGGSVALEIKMIWNKKGKRREEWIENTVQYHYTVPSLSVQFIIRYRFCLSLYRQREYVIFFYEKKNGHLCLRMRMDGFGQRSDLIKDRWKLYHVIITSLLTSTITTK